MKLRSLLAALALGVLPVTAAHAVSVSINIAPPAIPVYEQPLCPVEGYLWTPGYYAYDYDIGSYYWVDGVWVAPPRVGFLWTPGYWGYGGGFYAFHAGYWGPTVGFYGGINYGFGYGGYGYYGGRWDGRVFRYNTVVTRVNVTNVHNVYEDRNFHNRTDNRAAFNGRGGIEAKADSRERAAASARHVQATEGQRNALAQARTAHNPDGRQNAARRDQARNARADSSARTRDARRSANAARNTDASARVNRRVSRGAPNRERTAFQRNPGRGDRQRMVSNPGRGPRAPRGPQPGRQARGGRGGGRDDKKKH